MQHHITIPERNIMLNAQTCYKTISAYERVFNLMIKRHHKNTPDDALHHNKMTRMDIANCTISMYMIN